MMSPRVCRHPQSSLERCVGRVLTQGAPIRAEDIRRVLASSLLTGSDEAVDDACLELLKLATTSSGPSAGGQSTHGSATRPAASGSEGKAPASTAAPTAAAGAAVGAATAEQPQPQQVRSL